jgi:hypothetical protein
MLLCKLGETYNWNMALAVLAFITERLLAVMQ